MIAIDNILVSDEVVREQFVCDLLKCNDPGFANVEVNVEGYTGKPGDRLNIVCCKGHTEQTQAGFIVGFAWSPVYRSQVPTPR